MTTLFGPFIQSPCPYSNLLDRGARFGNEPAMRTLLGTSQLPPPSTVARAFVDAFPYFQGESGFVTRATLEHAANRLPTGDPYHDRMTQLARDVLSRPGMFESLDGINHGGHEDGLISLGDAQAVVFEYEDQEGAYMLGGPDAYNGGMRVGPGGNYGGMQGAPVNYYGDMQSQQEGYYGGMQRSRFENGYGANGARNYYPAASGMSPQNAEVANNFKQAKDSDLTTELGNNFDYFKPNEHGKITQKSLREVANRPLTDNPVDDRMTLLAKEIISRPGLNSKLDSDHNADIPDGKIGRDTIGRVSERDAAPSYKKMSDVDLLQALEEKFKQYWGADNYISFDSLKREAEKSPPTDMSELAAELLKRPGLMKELDIGTDGKGNRGAEDGRFNWVNLEYVIKEKQAHSSRG
ncbi:hypothetical protein SAMN03159342_03020 [Pseudomonas sp. NFPP04]|nr:hypothetical protein SAMN03159342_03020 [Pseudomonas sp. NFPP04]SFJ14918.1 hypothetical protein SAMN03159344_02702 [Pseudomonas sp. NFPP11]